MVDFQSRDTRRGITSDTGDSAESDNTNETTEPDEANETSSDSDVAKLDQESRYAVVTVADEGTIDEDQPGTAVVETLEASGETITTRELIQASYDRVQSVVGRLIERNDVDAILVLGGVGVNPDDVTPGAIEPLFDVSLPGFGELCRSLSYDADGTAVIRTRPTAGIAEQTPIFAVPDTEDAAVRATEVLILPETIPILREVGSRE